MSNKDHKLAAIVFTDIVGYTKRMEENEQLTMQLLQKQREIVFPIVESYGGEIIKEIGDGLLMMFTSAVEAVRCAISIQTRLNDEELTIRAGIHIGDVIFKGGDVFGSAVNTAARIEPLAPPNGICISETVRKQLENKDDIITISLGKKELKGVGMPVEIFQVFIEGVTTKQKKTPAFIMKDLWRRYVIQILFGYLIAAWIIKQAVAALTAKYLLSPHLVDLTWVILLSLIPTVFLIAYFHGKRSSGKWTKIEIIGFPVNAILAILLLVILFKGKDLGATTNKVFVENEDGEKIEKTILKSEFRKKVLLFFYEDKQKNTEDQWLSYGLPAMLEYDLSQDIFIRSRTAFQYIERFQQDGFNTGLDAPLLYKKKVSSSYNYNYFVTGSYTIANGTYTIITQVYESKSGKLVNEFNYNGENLFELADNISITIKKQIGFSDQQLGQMKDLPIKEIYTNSMPALEDYVKGMIAIHIDNNYDQGIDHMEKAILEDEEFAIAYLDIAQKYFNNNQLDKVNDILPEILQHQYKLSEREQYISKFFYYIIKQEADKALAVVKMWTKLFPDDIDAHMTLANRLQLKSDIPGAIKEYETILTLDPERFNIIRSIGYLYEALGNYDSALIYHQHYADKFPEDYMSYRNLANLYLLQNDFQNAKENYDNALLLEPEKVSLLLSQANVDMLLGEYDVAYNKFNEALTVCRTAGERGNVYASFDTYYTMLGQIQNAFSYYQKEVAENKISMTPLDYMVNQTFNIYKYVQAGKLKEGMDLLKELEPEFKPPVDKVIAFGYIFYYIQMEDVDKILPYIETAKELIYGFGQEALMVTVYFAEGRIAELNGNYEAAISSYMKFYEQQLTDNNIMRRIGACYRKNNQMKLAKEYLDKTMEASPFNPLNHLEMAYYYEDNGDKAKAKEHLLIALDVWNDADLDYKYANEARTKLSELESI